MLVEEAIKEIEEKRKMVLGWWSDEAVAKSLKAKFPQFIDSNYSPSINWESNWWNGIFISVYHIKNINDLKPIFQFLGKHGYLHSGEIDYYQEIRRVTWTFGNIKLLVFFTDENSQCKFVKKGTEVKDKYEFICPDMPKP